MLYYYISGHLFLSDELKITGASSHFSWARSEFRCGLNFSLLASQEAAQESKVFRSREEYLSERQNR